VQSKTILLQPEQNGVAVQPFLRWTGSKRWFTKDHIEKYLPKEFNNYHEPFLGGGAVFFHIKSLPTSIDRRFYLSDSNDELINAYKQIQASPVKVIKELSGMINTQEEYYRIRQKKCRSLITRAARFIYLNRTSFNGIYRVNPKGEYNVPYGYRPHVDFVTKDQLFAVNRDLQNIVFSTRDFKAVIKNVKKGDLVFLDPPYTVAHENNGFIEYNQNLFSWDDQKKLRDLAEAINAKGAYFILTNASHPSITELYQGVGKIERISRSCKVGGRLKTRGVYNEVVIYNTQS